MIFEKEMVLKHAQRADVPPCFFAELDEYLDFALSDKSIKNELEQYYARLFECDELIFPITKVRDISLPEKSEQRYPGFFSTAIFLTAASYFQTFLIENLSDS